MSQKCLIFAKNAAKSHSFDAFLIFENIVLSGTFECCQVE